MSLFPSDACLFPCAPLCAIPTPQSSLEETKSPKTHRGVKRPTVHAPLPRACPCPVPAPSAGCPWPGWVWLRTIQGFLMKAACWALASPAAAVLILLPFNQSRPASWRSGRKPQPLEQGRQRAGREASSSVIYLEQVPPDFVSQGASLVRCSVY